MEKKYFNPQPWMLMTPNALFIYLFYCFPQSILPQLVLLHIQRKH